MRLLDQPNQAEFASDPTTSDTPVRTTTRVPPSIRVSYAPSLPSVTIKGLPGGLVWLELGPFPSRDLVPKTLVTLVVRLVSLSSQKARHRYGNFSQSLDLSSQIKWSIPKPHYLSPLTQNRVGHLTYSIALFATQSSQRC